MGGFNSLGNQKSAASSHADRIACSAFSGSSGKADPTSADTMTAQYLPLAVSAWARVIIAVVLPVCLGAWMTK